MTETQEYPVMCDTYHPLRQSPIARELNDPSYAYSWFEAGDGRTAHEDPAGVTSHL